MTQVIWNGLFVGSFYALIALGYSMVYGIIKLLNFAHGDIYMLGAFVGFAALTSVGGIPASMSLFALLIVMLLSMLLTGVAGVAIERLAYRPLRSAPRLAVLITAVGASFALEYGVSAVAGPNPRSFPVRLEGGRLRSARRADLAAADHPHADRRRADVRAQLPTSRKPRPGGPCAPSPWT